MTILKLQFAGKIHKAEMRKAGDKDICEVSICKKVPAKGKDEERFDWAKITIWSPAEWAIPRLVKGAYISGIGDFALRPYEKDGVKKYSVEVRCNSFDFEVETLAERGESAPTVTRPAVGLATQDEPPF